MGICGRTTEAHKSPFILGHPVGVSNRDMGTVRGEYFGHGQDLLSFVSGTGTAMRYQWRGHSINGVTLSIW